MNFCDVQDLRKLAPSPGIGVVRIADRRDCSDWSKVQPSGCRGYWCQGDRLELQYRVRKRRFIIAYSLNNKKRRYKSRELDLYQPQRQASRQAEFIVYWYSDFHLWLLKWGVTQIYNEHQSWHAALAEQCHQRPGQDGVLLAERCYSIALCLLKSR